MTISAPRREPKTAGLLRSCRADYPLPSWFGLTFMPGMATYVGTKHFVSAFSESLRLEVAGTGVVVTQVCPGPVDTEFEQVAGNPTGHAVPKFVQISAERCAREALRGFARGRALVMPGRAIWLLTMLGRMTPWPILRLAYCWIGGYLRKRQVTASSPAPTIGRR